MKKYPECFPANFETDMLPKEARKENKKEMIHMLIGGYMKNLIHKHIL